jgi:hypothetical protein
MTKMKVSYQPTWNVVYQQDENELAKLYVQTCLSISNLHFQCQHRFSKPIFSFEHKWKSLKVLIWIYVETRMKFTPHDVPLKIL